METEMIPVRRAYKYRLYRCDKHDKALHHQLNAAGWIWNHALALQRRYYRLFGKHIPISQIKAHIAKLRRRVGRFVRWQQLGSQAVQDVLERQEEAWQRFFAKRSGLPRFKKVKRYKSFTLKQTAGWKLLVYNQNTPLPNGKYRRAMGVVRIGEVAYKFVQHRPLCGEIKTLTVKRDACGRLWVCFSVLQKVAVPSKPDLSRIGGFDFGLRHFLTDSTGQRWMHPECFRDVLQQLARRQRHYSRTQEGSHNREHARWLVARTHMRVADKRRDFHFKLAHELCDQFDVLVFEDLHIAAMKRLWGRKVSDLGFTKFLSRLKHIALLRGKVVQQIGRFEPTTQQCSGCGQRQVMPLKQRVFECPKCGLSLDRDYNAALNIISAGASALRLRGRQA